MDHAATMRRMYELISAGDIDGFGDLIADDLVEHEEAPGFESTKEGVKQVFHMYRAAFPDLRMEPQDIIVCGDKVVARMSFSATHTQPLLGIAPTGRRFTLRTIDIWRVENGKFAEHWDIVDYQGLQKQLRGE